MAWLHSSIYFSNHWHKYISTRNLIVYNCIHTKNWVFSYKISWTPLHHQSLPSSLLSSPQPRELIMKSFTCENQKVVKNNELLLDRIQFVGHMGREHASREKKLSMVIFLIFVQKNVSRIRFQEIKIRPWKGFEKMRFLCFYIIGV